MTLCFLLLNFLLTSTGVAQFVYCPSGKYFNLRGLTNESPSPFHFWQRIESREVSSENSSDFGLAFRYISCKILSKLSYSDLIFPNYFDTLIWIHCPNYWRTLDDKRTGIWSNNCMKPRYWLYLRTWDDKRKKEFGLRTLLEPWF